MKNETFVLTGISCGPNLLEGFQITWKGQAATQIVQIRITDKARKLTLAQCTIDVASVAQQGQPLLVLPAMLQKESAYKFWPAQYVVFAKILHLDQPSVEVSSTWVLDDMQATEFDKLIARASGLRPLERNGERWEEIAAMNRQLAGLVERLSEENKQLAAAESDATSKLQVAHTDVISLTEQLTASEKTVRDLKDELKEWQHAEQELRKQIAANDEECEKLHAFLKQKLEQHDHP
ncbi:MAG: hypothetical protein V4481_01230 [Patescibacteria group bacterium]